MSAPAKIPPSEVTQVRATSVTPRSVSLAWKPPATGSRPIRYTVFFRVHGPNVWNVAAITSDVSVVISSLMPSTEYEFEVMAHNN